MRKSTYILLVCISVNCLLVTVAPCYSKSIVLKKILKSSDNRFTYKIDTTEYHSVLFSLKGSSAGGNTSSCGLRVICNNDSVHFNYFTNNDSLEIYLHPYDTMMFR